MKVAYLISELSKLPLDAEIGTFDVDTKCISSIVQIFTRNSELSNLWGNTSVKEIEDARHSNINEICDYYIG